ncbi:MAG: ATP-dependent Clp protease proteolytic subunit [Planctomycetes bacterium]|nr:ATP-dependent Clp protease proteolytic subunit [Planctomycetota bacterium]
MLKEDLDDELRRRQASRLDDDDPDEDDEEENREDRNSKESVITLDLLRQERTVVISEVVTPKLTQRVLSQLLWLDAQGEKPIKLFINTPGGSADDGFAIYDLMRFVKAPILSVCVGLNASAGTIILLGSPRERRLALPNARIMIHQPSGGGRGRVTDIEITADEILKLRLRANELIARETGQPLDRVEKDTDRDYWMSAEEAKAYGLVSRVIRSLRDIQ